MSSNAGICIPATELSENSGSVKWVIIYQKDKGSLGNVGIMGFVFTNFQADNYGTSSGDDEGNCVYN